MDITSTVEDTFGAARRMHAAGVAAIVVLGGDGTHRAVARECGDIPIAGLSTGTNNAFPQIANPPSPGWRWASRLGPPPGKPGPGVEQGPRGLDQGVPPRHGAGGRGHLHRPLVGTRALWRTESLRSLYVAYADPEAIGLSAIAGLLEPVGRPSLAAVLSISVTIPRRRKLTLLMPIAPGIDAAGRHRGLQKMDADRTFLVDGGRPAWWPSMASVSSRSTGTRRGDDHVARERLSYRGRVPLPAVSRRQTGCLARLSAR